MFERARESVRNFKSRVAEWWYESLLTHNATMISEAYYTGRITPSQAKQYANAMEADKVYRPGDFQRRFEEVLRKTAEALAPGAWRSGY